ncbi:hypothetical protein [Streptomyces sp.]|uniref:hypothetical protein n=1 Tax=Streptomyces sp. TaxID=1931 RepID=UPI002F92A3B8
MGVYQRGAGAHVAERVQAEPGSDEEARLERLVEDTSSGWRRVDDEAAEGGGDGSGDAPKQPAKSASQAAWVEWAVSQGADRDAVKDAKRDDLIAQYGKE